MIFSEQRRRAYLEAIGIDVWLPRDTIPSDDTVPGEDTAPLDWDQLRHCVSGCTRCELSQSRTQTVFGVGNPDADWMIIGEAPGAEEDRRGEPFVGRAGQLLDLMLHAIGQRRESVFIANILKCRPPNNRDPKPAEAAACRATQPARQAVSTTTCSPTGEAVAQAASITQNVFLSKREVASANGQD